MGRRTVGYSRLEQHLKARCDNRMMTRGKELRNTMRMRNEDDGEIIRLKSGEANHSGKMVKWCWAVEAGTDKLESDSFNSFEPMQLFEKNSYGVSLPGTEDEPRSNVHHELEALEPSTCNTGVLGCFANGSYARCYSIPRDVELNSQKLFN